MGNLYTYTIYTKDLYGFRHENFWDVAKTVEKYRQAGRLDEIVRIDRVEDVTHRFLAKEKE